MSPPKLQDSTDVKWMAVPEVLRTQRLVIRPFRPTDAAAIFERWAQDSAVWRYMRWWPRTAIEQTEQAVEQFIEGRRHGTALSWAITLAEDDEASGMVGLVPDGHMAELGYMLARDAWGRGLAAEAAGGVVRAALELTGVCRIWAMCDVDNLASARVLEKVRMQYEGTLRRYALRPNLGPEPRDVRLYARIR